jgi:hypothetical protein
MVLRRTQSRILDSRGVRTRPKLGEFPSAGAAVIDECAPQKMPDNLQEYLTAVIAWFARWNQRVIPNAVWQQTDASGKEYLAGAAVDTVALGLSSAQLVQRFSIHAHSWRAPPLRSMCFALRHSTHG